jgi:hypothetical protein
VNFDDTSREERWFWVDSEAEIREPQTPELNSSLRSRSTTLRDAMVSVSIVEINLRTGIFVRAKASKSDGLRFKGVDVIEAAV